MYVCRLLCELAPNVTLVLRMEHLFPGFSQYADDVFSVSVYVCVCTGECVCVYALSLSQRFKYFRMKSQVNV